MHDIACCASCGSFRVIGQYCCVSSASIAIWWLIPYANQWWFWVVVYKWGTIWYPKLSLGGPLMASIVGCDLASTSLQLKAQKCSRCGSDWWCDQEKEAEVVRSCIQRKGDADWVKVEQWWWLRRQCPPGARKRPGRIVCPRTCVYYRTQHTGRTRPRQITKWN